MPFSCFEVARRTDGVCRLCAPAISRCSRRTRFSLGTRIPCDCRKTVSPPRYRHPRSWSARITEDPSLSYYSESRKFNYRAFQSYRSDGWGYVVDSNLSTVDPHRNGGIGTRIRTKYEIDRRSRKTLFWKWTRWKSVGLVWCLTLIATAIDALGISQ